MLGRCISSGIIFPGVGDAHHCHVTRAQGHVTRAQGHVTRAQRHVTSRVAGE